MPSNSVVINGNIEYEVPDSFMVPLMSYLDMVKRKCSPVEEKRSEDTDEACVRDKTYEAWWKLVQAADDLSHIFLGEPPNE